MGRTVSKRRGYLKRHIKTIFPQHSSGNRNYPESQGLKNRFLAPTTEMWGRKKDLRRKISCLVFCSELVVTLIIQIKMPKN